jgi:hypothetical protein
MNIVKYLCEFFFCNFWHWLGLAIITMLLMCRHIHIHENNKNDKK